MLLGRLARKLADPIAGSVLADAAGWSEASRAERRAGRSRREVLASYARLLRAR